jgi:hypothetical protein
VQAAGMAVIAADDATILVRDPAGNQVRITVAA